jgi:hypothetical protein
VLISPTRWFPIDGHAITIGKTSFSATPIVPWLPERWTRARMAARNYWPHQLVGHVRAAGFTIQEIGFIRPVLEQYRWLPTRLIQAYQHRMTTLHQVPGLRRFGLSTLVVGLKPAGGSPSWSCVSHGLGEITSRLLTPPGTSALRTSQPRTTTGSPLRRGAAGPGGPRE